MRLNNGRRNRVIGGFMLPAAIALAGGCAGGGSGAGAGPGRTGSPSAAAETEAAEWRAPMPSGLQDAAFIDAMINFSQLNCMLADSQLSNGTRPEVKEVAEKMKRRESINIEFLMSERARLGVARGVPNFLDSPRAADAKRRLEGLNGIAVDEFFVEHMIRNRLEIAKVAESSSSSVDSANLRYFCRTLADDAGPELRELRSVQTDDYPIPANARAGSKGYSGRR